MNKTTKLLEEFKAPTKEEWRAAAEKLLKGKPFDKIMKRMTPEGIELEPIFWRDVLDNLPASETQPGFDGYLRGTSAAGYNQEPWEVAQELPYGTPKEFNDAAREDLMRGQNALNIILDIATLKGIDPDSAGDYEVGACGLSIACLEDVKTAFKEIVPDAVSFHIRTGCAGLSVGAMFFAWLKQQGADLKAVKGSLGMDPIAVQAAAGALPVKLSELLDEQATLARYCAENAPGVKAITVSTLPYHQAGGSSVDELGAALATGAYYIEQMLERGLTVDEAAKQIRFSFAIGPNFFMEIAKIRAARVLWAKVVAAFGGSTDAQKISIHARTGLYNKTQKDPYVNMLRTTTEALSGVIAGVDSLCVGNFDEVTRLPDTFARRISRNTQVILQEECELTGVVDPAGGSWAVEWLTNEVCEKSWALFQEIEAKGGITGALKAGFVQDKVASTAAGMEKQLNGRRMSLVGTNVYPDVAETPLDVKLPDYKEIKKNRSQDIAAARTAQSEDADAQVMAALGKILESNGDTLLDSLIAAVEAGATLGEITKTVRADLDPEDAIRPLPSTRLAAKYEALRNASDKYEAETGKRPMIFLCNLGALRRHKARADFTKAFFAAGGFDVISPEGFNAPEDAVAALTESGAGIAVVCGTDDDYAEQFASYAQAIKTAIPETRLVLAGYPGDNEDAYRAAGMDDFIFIKSDNYAMNHEYLQGLGVL
ncbi:methylmalonyl-CoA mutase family protein [Coraliomargarita akajimensis]|uniref:Methylmalonyl-CoA mutase, large subunit n=1 Tax=Coraliomargarita akajimensis (strain DSM 45221 / IAM 15411 / JCM 23193 / KCTC 12865 / 04OKA010-24) TaxID=583355 RepID=D5EQ57_CORAD|nr:methylmalonyl-CoA mutase family protein [Coraliomargarita akajimensis]ADE53825.1 methylmalonyl-CoA mutase, large subunit [Coraliomargarita akajimensis DSM 45221]